MKKNIKRKNDYAVFIVSYKRPDRVYTYYTLRRQGYTGEIFIVVSKDDETKDEYIRRFGDKVILFDKKDYLNYVDLADNFVDDLVSSVFVYNALWDIVAEKGYRYFIMSDDDYLRFEWTHNEEFVYKPKKIKNLDKVFEIIWKFYKNSLFDIVAIAQAGDFIGGRSSLYSFLFGESLKNKRKIMNFYFCDTEKPVEWLGRFNNDVNTYLYWGRCGRLFFTIYNVRLLQELTQQNPGGITEAYKKFGTYYKSFQSVLFCPSCVKLSLMGNKYKRIHHKIEWKYAVPVIIDEKFRK